MSLLDSILGTSSGSNTDAGGFSSIVGNLLTQHGGLGGLVEKFQYSGLGEVVQSWISTGHNLPISPDQLQSVLGNEQVAALASKMGIDPQQAAQQLSTYLPQIVDKLTPNGEMPANGDTDIMGSLGKMFGR